MATKRKRTAGAANKAPPRLTLEEVLGQITDTITVFDTRWTIVYVNDAAVATARRSREELVGRSLWDAFPDLIGTDIERHYRRAMAEQVPVTFESHYAPLDLHFEARLLPSRDRLVAYGRDITERKQAEIALASSERRYRHIVETAHEGIWVCDAGFRGVWMNQRMAQMMRGAAEDYVGKHVFEVIHEADYPEVRRQMEVRRQGLVSEYDFRFRRQDGTVFWALARIAPIMGEDGSFQGALGMFTDITARKQAELELHAEREWFRVTLSSIGDAVIATDHTGRITFMNAVAEQLTGWTIADAGGRPLEDVFRIVNEDTGVTVESPVTKVLREGGVVGLANHTALISRDGSSRPIDDSGAPIRGAHGNLLGVVLVFRDNSERRRTEQALRDADRRKDEFLAMLGHELRNPLAPIASALEIVKLAPHDPEALGRSREVIERQVQHMTRLVDDLLDVSRITRGKIMLRRSTVAFDQVLARAVETVRPALEKHRQQLAQTLPGEALTLDADATRLAQVLANLLHNASKYSPDGSTIELIAAREGNDLVVTVRDRGRGMAPSLLEVVFDPFVQGEPPAGRVQAGLGIGLTLVRNLVSLHGGTVAARSEGPGKGSAFTIRMPVVLDQPRAVVAPMQGSPVAASGRRILIVDDNTDAADTLARLLTIVGHEPSIAYDANDALRALGHWRPDVVLLDIGLPRISGYELAQQLRRDSQFAKLKLVALTGYGQDEDRRRSLEAGFDSHLVKPVDVDALNQLLSSLFADSPLH